MGSTLQIVILALQIASTLLQITEPLTALAVQKLVAALEKKQMQGSRMLTTSELQDMAAQSGVNLKIVERVLGAHHMKLQEIHDQ